MRSDECTTEFYNVSGPLITSGIAMVAAPLLLCLVSARWGVTSPAVEESVIVMTVCMALGQCTRCCAIFSPSYYRLKPACPCRSMGGYISLSYLFRSLSVPGTQYCPS
ncbi:hypothetical protein B0H16DRAFT_1493496 [Mycena metata]|uniref:Uncharacterized protein n=1 Tax=Mycena metata TaxID=1033252 RepID=A0AAD7P299_9AGAR|nr:hypothetical protein B0H16DRAFT_1493496 [Mycena metata]